MGKNKFNDFDWLTRIFEDNAKRSIKDNTSSSIEDINEDLPLDDLQIEEVTSWDLPTDFENVNRRTEFCSYLPKWMM